MTPTRLATPSAPLRRPIRLVAAVAALAFAWGATASAQSLPSLLPQDAAVAIGLHDLASESERVQPFLDEAERLGLIDTLGAAIPAEATDELDVEENPVPEALRGLETMDVLGQEAWLVVSASQSRPIPAATMIARVSPDTADAFATAMADAMGEDPGVARLEEEGRGFYTRMPSDDDDLPLPLAYAQSDDVVVASTDVEIVRFVLRAQSGVDEPSMDDAPLYASLQELGDGAVRWMMDADPLLGAAQPFAASTEFGPLLSRFRDAIRTAGPSTGVIRVTDDGIASSELQRPDASGPDASLHGLLTQSDAPGAEVLSFAPAGAIAVSAGTFDVNGWWAWLDDVLGSVAEQGVPTATQALAMFEIDARSVLLDWAGTRIAQVQASPPEAVQPGVTPNALLGSQVLLIDSRDDAAAKEGLATLLGAIGPNLGAFTSPDAQGSAAPTRVEVAGHEVLRLEISDGFLIDAAVVDGWVLLSGSSDATATALEAYAQGGGASVLNDAHAQVPSGVRSWSVSDTQGALRGSVGGLVGQLQMMAGMAGGANLDFQSVDEAGTAIEAYAEFVAERLGASVSYTTVEDGALRSQGSTEIDW
ncbi:MAG: hypothetical protein U5K81_03780 [Trueperaceae bacterium]|nr:hypothetical protein [Trueperaceae bacterium]